MVLRKIYREENSWYSDRLRAGQLWFDSLQLQQSSLYLTEFRPNLWYTKPHIQYIPLALFIRGQCGRCEKLTIHL